jgi:hypothetical protein
MVTCRKCGTEKDSREFAPSRIRKGGSFWCRACVTEYARRQRLNPDVRERDREYTETERLRHTKKGAGARGLAFRLSDAVALELIKSPCFYCGAPPDPVSGIDRIDSALGYEDGNVVACCTRCNKAKGTLSQGEFYRMCREVAVLHTEEEA